MMKKLFLLTVFILFCLLVLTFISDNTSEHPVNENSKQSTVNYTEIDCSDCDGLGIIPWGWMVKDEVGAMPGDL